MGIYLKEVECGEMCTFVSMKPGSDINYLEPNQYDTAPPPTTLWRHHWRCKVGGVGAHRRLAGVASTDQTLATLDWDPVP